MSGDPPMSKSNGSHQGFFTFHRPPWQQQIPKRLRNAAEWYFGVLPVTAVALLLQTEFVGALVTLGAAGGLYLLTAGWFPSRRINSPVLWWTWVIAWTVLGYGAMVISLLSDFE